MENNESSDPGSQEDVKPFSFLRFAIIALGIAVTIVVMSIGFSWLSEEIEEENKKVDIRSGEWIPIQSLPTGELCWRRYDGPGGFSGENWVTRCEGDK